MSALSSYRESLRELEKKGLRVHSKGERELLIIGKMKVLADQLDGDAKSLILKDIQDMEALSESRDSDSEADANSTQLISLAFAACLTRF